jgi:DNA ligase (NAD+)
MKDRKDEIRALEKEINKLRSWEDAYYNGSPLVPDPIYDAERDRIVALIKKLRPDHPYLDEVGAPVPDGSVWPKFTHSEVMGSLFKVNSEADFRKWGSKRGNTYFLAEKADGCTIVAYYENGKLVTLATRGDGVIGEDITPNARYFQNVRLTLPDLPRNVKFTGILRGEGLIELDAFNKHFAPLGMANPRNAASGKVRDTKNPHLKRHIVVKWFDIITDDVDCKLWIDKYRLIEYFCLETIPHYHNLTLTQVWAKYEEYVQHRRKNLQYWIDGLVARVADITKHDSFGITDKRPKGSIAIKFPATGVESILLGIEFSRGRSGRIAPVGLIKPVLIDGTTVSRVSLHGADWIKQMDVAVGDTVIVAKAGDIIPQIIRVTKRPKDRKPIIFPKTCPECNVKLVKSGAYIECQNKSCAGETYGAIAKWLEKTGIKGIGDSILQELIKEVTDIAELYEADMTVFAKAARGSNKLGRKIFSAIQQTRSIDLAVFLSALHIDTLGSTNGQRIANHFKTLKAVMQAKEADFRKIEGIAENAAKIEAGLKRKKDLIEKLEQLLNIQDVTEGSLTNKSFCITGKLSRKRSEIETWIKSHGGICKGSVDKNLSYLVTNTPDSGSSKNKKADKYGVKKITEDQLYTLVGDDDGPDGDIVQTSRPIVTKGGGTIGKAQEVKGPKRAVKTRGATKPKRSVKTQGVKKRFSVKRGKGTMSLFDDVFGSKDKGWVDVAEGGEGKFLIVGNNLVDPGSPQTAKTRLGFVAWDKSVQNLDLTDRFNKLGVSTHLKSDNAEMMETMIFAKDWQSAESIVQKTTFSSWSEGDL